MDPGTAEPMEPVEAAPAEAAPAEAAPALTQREQNAEVRAAQKERNIGNKERQKEKKLGDTIRRFSYLLGQTELFQHFCDLKKERDPDFAAMLEKAEVKNQETSANNKAKAQGRAHRKSEKEEDEEMLAGGADGGDDDIMVFTESPGFVKEGTMRDYQLAGLNWMISLYHNGINGILADEMGLGKTLQTISFLGYLKEYADNSGPHLVIVPKTTLENWTREFRKWVPSLDVAVLNGDKDERAATVRDVINPLKFDVLLSTYELVLREKSPLQKVAWSYIVIDEAHRIKNVDSSLSNVVRSFDSRNRLLVTGTPLQNDLHELWALLNFLLPDVFSNVEDFDAWFDRQRGGDADDTDAMNVDGDQHGDQQPSHQRSVSTEDSIVKQLHSVLKPFLLRRVKSDVEKTLLPKKEVNLYVGMSPMQRKWYKSILEKDIDAVNGGVGKKEGKQRLLNIVMQLKKCCNHPYLFDGAEPGPPFTNDYHLVENSAKLMVLDKMLDKFKKNGDRVLIFCQMSRMLDILEDYCYFREYNYCRLDGSTDHESRMNSIDAFNAPASDKFLFLLTTRAGGLGINLVTANIVIIFDSDWNPQADLQAMDRAHRIGQTKQVYVFRMVTEHAIEEKVIERASQKLRLDQLVIQQGRAHTDKTREIQGQGSKDDLVNMIQHGASNIMTSGQGGQGAGGSEDDVDIDAIIRRGEEKTDELNQKYAQFTLDDLQNFHSEFQSNEWEGETYNGNNKRPNPFAFIELSKRERKQNYNIDGYYRETIYGPPKEHEPKQPAAPKPPKQIPTPDYQFHDPELERIQDKETAYFRRTVGYVFPKKDKENKDQAAKRIAEQEKVDNAEPLTDEEVQRKNELIHTSGFQSWSRRDYHSFIRGCELYGRHDYASILLEFQSPKTVEDLKQYARVFWQRYTDSDEFIKAVNRIEDAEERRDRDIRQTLMLRYLVDQVKFPLHNLRVPYTPSMAKASHGFSEDNDRFILCQLAKYGFGLEDTYDRIKVDIEGCPLFTLDFFFRTRSAAELQRRGQSLVGLIVKNFENTHDLFINKKIVQDKKKKPKKKKSTRY